MSANANAKKILIVEDEMLVQLHLDRTVVGMGHQVTAKVRTAAEAIEAAERERPDLALIDINLPGPRDGISLARELIERFGSTIVFATAHADEETLDRAQSVRASGYLVKPFTSAELRAAISTAVAFETAHAGALSNAHSDADARTNPTAGPGRTGREERPFGPGTRMLFYSHDTFGMGHLQRSLKLIQAIMTGHPDISLLLVTGSSVVHRYELPAGADYVKLPAVQKVGSDDYASRSLLMSGSGVRNLRTNLLLRIVRDYDPNVLFVDHSPAGMQGEMVPALEWLSDRTRCRRVLGMRDVTDDAANVRALWKKQGIDDLIARHYDDLLIFGDKAIYDPVQEYGLGNQAGPRIEYMGFVCENSEPAPAPKASPGDRPKVAVSIGGGDGAVSTLFAYLDMLEEFGDALDVESEILTGPLIADDDLYKVRERARNLPVTITKFLPSTAEFFAHADLVVATAGYNTVTQIFRYAKRALLVPRVLYRREQLVRSRRLEELGLVHCLHPMDISPQRMHAVLARALADPAQPLEEARRSGAMRLDGAERFAEHCGKFTVSVDPGEDAAAGGKDPEQNPGTED
ncbi:MAG: response regulator [Myxococcota bacterium]|nr:response regulator [Myxococcota bacterium]